MVGANGSSMRGGRERKGGREHSRVSAGPSCHDPCQQNANTMKKISAFAMRVS